MAGADQGLPPKDAALFRSIVKHYDNKAYKKGVKVADTILK
jgi:peptide alpha-N-acetyltransferase